MARLKRFYPVRDAYFGRGLSQDVKLLEEFVFAAHRKKDRGLPGSIPKGEVLFFQRFFREYETLLELREAREFVAHRKSAKHYLYKERVLSRTLDYARAEGRMAHMSRSDRVLIIGSGPFPETAIGYVKEFGCRVVCLDRRRRFVEISREVVKELGLQDRIEIRRATHDNVDPDRFTKILVVALAFPKREILNRLRGCRADIILRSSRGSSRLVYANVDERLLMQHFKIKRRLVRWGKNFTSSMLVESKD